MQGFREGKEKQVANRPTICLYRGHARFTGPHTVNVNGEALESEKIFIDTGARPRIPEHPRPLCGRLPDQRIDHESHHVARTPDRARRQLHRPGIRPDVFARFGAQVTVIQDAPQIVPREDPEVAAELQRALEAEGMKFILNAKTTHVHREEDLLIVTLEVAGDRIEPQKTATGSLTGSHLLVAVGRRPNTDDLGLDSAGIGTDAHGFIKVNSRLETNVPGVCATGDVKGGPAFTHISYNDYQIVYGNLIEGKNLSIENRIVPYSLFHRPATRSCRPHREGSARQGLQIENWLGADVLRGARD